MGLVAAGIIIIVAILITTAILVWQKCYKTKESQDKLKEEMRNLAQDSMKKLKDKETYK